MFALSNYIELNLLLCLFVCLFVSSRTIVSISVNLCDFRQVTVPRHADLVPRLQHLACHCDHERSVESGAQCLAGIINKLPDGKCSYFKCKYLSVTLDILNALSLKSDRNQICPRNINDL